MLANLTAEQLEARRVWLMGLIEMLYARLRSVQTRASLLIDTLPAGMITYKEYCFMTLSIQWAIRATEAELARLSLITLRRSFEEYITK